MIEGVDRFRGDVQGLRALAVLAVVLYHTGVPFVAGGYVGVDVFFVISGFLITGHLLRERERTGRVALGPFYARRARRILPASFAVLLASLLAALVWYPPLLLREVWNAAVATAFFVPNYFFAVTGTDYLAESTPSLFQHYWSLGIEEQFYLVWPIVLIALTGVLRTRRSLFLVLAVVTTLSFAACVVQTSASQPWAFFSLHTRAWELAVGGLVALALQRRSRPFPAPVAAAIGWAGVAGIVASVLLFSDDIGFPGAWAAVPVCATAAVIVAGSQGGGPSRTLSLPPLLFVGALSYALYLVHWPLMLIPQAAVGFDHPLPLVAKLGLAALAVPVAWLLRRLVEEPGRHVGWLTRARPRRTLAAAGVASAVVALAATVAYAVSETRPLHSERVVSQTTMTGPPAVTDVVPANLVPALDEVAEDQPSIYADGCNLGYAEVDPVDCVDGDLDAPRIVLFGDSHAAQWFPALQRVARERGWALESHTKSSCPSVDVAVLRSGVPYGECDRWRDAVIDRLAEDPPTVVVLANYGSADLAVEADRTGQWADGMRSTLSRIAAPVVVLADTPDLRTSPTVCLSAHLESARSCAKETSIALDGETREVERTVTDAAHVPYIDLTDHLCTSELCAPILGSTLVYRDSHHLTATASALLGGPLARAMTPLLDAMDTLEG